MSPARCRAGCGVQTRTNLAPDGLSYCTTEHRSSRRAPAPEEPAPPVRVHPPGKTIEELSVGDSASVTKRISQADVDAFARISGDDNPAHVDAVWAAASLLGGRVVHGMLTAGLISAVLGTLLPGPGSIYLSQTLRWVAPVWPDDLLTATATVKEIVAEKGRVVLETVVTRDGEPVLTGEALVMAPPAALPRPARRRPREGEGVIGRVAVVGAGVMGSEIAQAAAAGGVEVVLLDADAAALERGLAHVARIGERRVARGRMSAGEAEAIAPPRRPQPRTTATWGPATWPSRRSRRSWTSSGRSSGAWTRPCRPPRCWRPTPRGCRSRRSAARRAVPTASSASTSSTRRA